jgi:hypothetical protein
MLRLRLRYLLESKGIIRPYNFLIRNGFTPNIATRCINGKIEQLKLSHVNKLCTALQCTPDDLLEWYAGENETLPDNHPLLSLVRNDKPFNIIGHINKLSFDQIKEVEQIIAKMSSSGSEMKQE